MTCNHGILHLRVSAWGDDAPFQPVVTDVPYPASAEVRRPERKSASILTEDHPRRLSAALRLVSPLACRTYT